MHSGTKDRKYVNLGNGVQDHVHLRAADSGGNTTLVGSGVSEKGNRGLVEVIIRPRCAYFGLLSYLCVYLGLRGLAGWGKTGQIEQACRFDQCFW